MSAPHPHPRYRSDRWQAAYVRDRPFLQLSGEDLDEAHTHTLLAVYVLAANQPTVTIRDVGRLTGEESTSQVWRTLRTLRGLGLLTWEDGRSGTLRPLLGLAAHTAQPRLRVEVRVPEEPEPDGR